MGRKTRTREQFEVEFWRKAVRNTDSGCLEWTKARDGKGYAYTWYKGKVRRAARIAFELTHRVLLRGENVLHDCDNRKCIEPSHLNAGTQKKNVADMVKRGRWKGNLIVFGEKQLEAIAKARKFLTQQEVAILCGVTRFTLRRIEREYHAQR